MFTPGMNGKQGRKPIKVKHFHYSEEYKKNGASEFDFGVLELEEDLEETNGYLGIDARLNNADGVDDIEVCGYPGDKEKHTMWSAHEPYKNNTEYFLKYKMATEVGQSGSPIIKKKENKMFIIGVHIGSNAKCTRNIAVKLTTQKRKIINEWVAEITGEL